MSNKFLNYKRYDLNQSDATILKSGGWLTSDCLQFAFASIINNSDGSLTHSKFAFLNPLTIMMLSHGDTETQASIVEDCDLTAKDLIFIPLNDADATSSTNRGTHWRLLIYCKSNASFHLYDSSSSSSGGTDLGTQANGLVNCLAPFLINQNGQVGETFTLLKPRTHMNSARRCTCVQEKCPQQENGYDCGAFVISIVKFLYTSFSNDAHTYASPSDVSNSMLECVTQEQVTKDRVGLYARAVELRQEQDAAEKK